MVRETFSFVSRLLLGRLKTVFLLVGGFATFVNFIIGVLAFNHAETISGKLAALAVNIAFWFLIMRLLSNREQHDVELDEYADEIITRCNQPRKYYYINDYASRGFSREEVIKRLFKFGAVANEARNNQISVMVTETEE